jgi:hypothetical protein
MKIKVMVLSSLLFAGFATANAQADEFCSLSVNPQVIYPGQAFTFNVNARSGRIFPGPLDPGLTGPFTVVFYGTKNGVTDIPAGGWVYTPKKAPFGTTTLDGFANTVGGEYAGTYTRYAALVTANGTTYCVTNEVAAILVR